MYYTKRQECNKQLAELEYRGETYTSKFIDLDDQQKGLKLLMNALYGKLCEKGHHTGIVYHESRFTKFKKDDEYYPCILTGSFITYRSRLELLHKIKASLQAGCDFLYADTDSVIIGCPKDLDYTTIFGTNNGNLGEWKEEGVYDVYLSLGKKKKYALINTKTMKKNKVVLSGVHNDVTGVIKAKLESDFCRTFEDIKYIFDRKNNVLFERARPTNVYTQTFNQLVLYRSNYQINRDAGEPTAILRVVGDDYILEKCQER